MESKNKRIGRNDTEPIKQETSNHLFCLFQFDSILNEQKQKRDKEHLYCLSLLSCPSPNPVRSAIKVIIVC